MDGRDNWIGKIVSAIEAGPICPWTAIFITWKDCGGFYSVTWIRRHPDKGADPTLPGVESDSVGAWFAEAAVATVAWQDGKPTFHAVMRELAALKRHQVEWKALTTIKRGKPGLGFTGLPILEGRVPRAVHPVDPRRGTSDRSGVSSGTDVADRSVAPRGTGDS